MLHKPAGAALPVLVPRVAVTVAVAVGMLTVGTAGPGTDGSSALLGGTDGVSVLGGGLLGAGVTAVVLLGVVGVTGVLGPQAASASTAVMAIVTAAGRYVCTLGTVDRRVRRR